MSKNLLITGASSGIGKAVALEFAKRDGSKNHLILVARNREKLEGVAEEARSFGAEVSVLTADFGQKESIAKLFIDLEKSFPILDLVFNNAGLGFVKEAHLLTDDEVEQIIDVNVKGMILVGKKAANIMIKQGYGHIIFTSSLAGYVLLPKWSVYCASKWGITAFANILRQETSKFGVKITTVHPGPVKTEFFDSNKADVDLSGSEKSMPAIPVEDVSGAIYEIAYTDKERIFCPPSLGVSAEAFRLFPKFMKKVFAKLVK
jgi:short-subunit dehydrogenase